MARGYPVSMKLYDGYGLYHLHPYISFGLHIEERLERFVLYCKSLGSTRSRAGLVLREISSSVLSLCNAQEPSAALGPRQALLRRKTDSAGHTRERGREFCSRLCILD